MAYRTRSGSKFWRGVTGGGYNHPVDKKKAPVWSRGTTSTERIIPLVRRVRNACGQGEALVALTRIALEEIGSTKGFKQMDEMGRTVVAEIDGKRFEHGNWAATYSKEINAVVMQITTQTNCKHQWMFSWPRLQMFMYEMVSCTCERSEVRQAKAS